MEKTLDILNQITDDRISLEDKKELLDSYRKYVSSFHYKFQVAQVINECAIFKHKKGMESLMSESKKEKESADYKKELASIFLKFAQDIYETKED